VTSATHRHLVHRLGMNGAYRLSPYTLTRGGHGLSVLPCLRWVPYLLWLPRLPRLLTVMVTRMRHNSADISCLVF